MKGGRVVRRRPVRAGASSEGLLAAQLLVLLVGLLSAGLAVVSAVAVRRRRLVLPLSRGT